jgi:hypothetical protein
MPSISKKGSLSGPELNTIVQAETPMQKLIGFGTVAFLSVSAFMLGAFGMDALTSPRMQAAIAQTVATDAAEADFPVQSKPELAAVAAKPAPAKAIPDPEDAAPDLAEAAPPADGWSDESSATTEESSSSSSSGGDEEIVKTETVSGSGTRAPKPADEPGTADGGAGQDGSGDASNPSETGSGDAQPSDSAPADGATSDEGAPAN